ncbi:MAG: MBL fold metallo-hydrolase [Candidatus Omnitrophota bacterium]|nr:MBL fold metallo-hydrolase [Candidatus Omnitrophota bacterium]
MPEVRRGNLSLRICVLKSGSSGNCTAIWTGRSAILVDCGGRTSTENFCQMLNAIDLQPARINGIVVTHGHGDHINLDTFKIAKEFDIPLYIHRKTLLKGSDRKSKCPRYLIQHHNVQMFSVKEFKITPFRSAHEGGNVGQPHGFCIEYEQTNETYKIGYLTDTSQVSRKMVEALSNSHCLVIEANHDLEMIENNPPHHANWKQHLSNEATADAIAKILKNSTNNAPKYIFLAHLSRDNNTPRVALRKITKRIREEGFNKISVLLTNQVKKSQIKKLS